MKFSHFLLVGCWALSACTTPLAERLSCSNSDWFEIGRRDGASGAPIERIASYRKTCGGSLDAQFEDMYKNGRNTGLVEYCTGRNGFELGRMRVAYNSVCPSMMEQTFLKSYQKGERARSLETENKKLGARIDQITQTLSNERALASDNHPSLQQELKDLRQRQAQNDRELQQLSHQ